MRMDFESGVPGDWVQPYHDAGGAVG